MQYTLPLKQKQIEQSKLEAEARKEATIENADAEGQAKVIDSKAEVQRRNLLADAEANRIRVTAAADAERMQSEAKLLNQSPLLINKIIAERLSDKIQMVMVPSDGKFFFANDVFQGHGRRGREESADATQLEGGDASALWRYVASRRSAGPSVCRRQALERMGYCIHRRLLNRQPRWTFVGGERCRSAGYNPRERMKLRAGFLWQRWRLACWFRRAHGGELGAAGERAWPGRLRR